MWPYWLLFVVPLFGVLARRRMAVSEQRLLWWLVAAFYTVMIGLRYQVGGDWFTYANHMQSITAGTLANALTFGEPGYYGLSWLVAQLGGSIFVVNLLCGAMVMAGVVTFARAQPRPWLALLVAVPYLIIVVAMGYTRQSVALGFALIGLVALGRQQTRAFVVWVLIGAVFHRSAVLLLPIAALAASRRRVWNLFWVCVVAALGALLLVGKDSETLWQNYVVADYQSEGGLIRVVMNAVPAVLILLFRRRLISDEAERRLWVWMAVLSLVCIPLVIISSTAVDRVALYFIPIQMYVFARFDRLAGSRQSRSLLVMGVVVYYAAIEFVWLNFAKTAFAWLPYHFMPW